MLNALNPAFPLTSQRLASGAQRADFVQPTAFAGDFRQPEQRVGQIGFGSRSRPQIQGPTDSHRIAYGESGAIRGIGIHIVR